MRPRAFVLALPLIAAACSRSPEAEAVVANAQVLEAELRAKADELDRVARDAADADASAAIGAAAENLQGQAENVQEQAEDVAANL